MKIIFCILIFGTIFLSCKKEEGLILEDEPYGEQLIKNASDTVVIEDHSYVLSAYLWRDFQPVYLGKNGRPMIAINTLINLDSVAIPDHIKLVQQFVINGGSTWVAGFENEAPPYLPAYQKQGISRNGPKWGPKIYVTVIAAIRDSKKNISYFLKQKNVFIERTD